jgi:phage shock protein C
MIAGVASGLGRYFNLDPTLIRVIFAVAAVLTGGLALLTYPVMWFLMPEEPASAPAWPHPSAGGAPWQRPGGTTGWPPPGPVSPPVAPPAG